MVQHFIMNPGIWIGEGRILMSASPELIRFYTKWVVEDKQNNIIVCRQQVEMQNVEDHVKNTYTFSNINSKNFDVQLQNELFGDLKGKGLITDKSIAWEFTQSDSFQGFEVYELVENGDYMVHAEYISTDQYRTTVDCQNLAKSYLKTGVTPVKIGKKMEIAGF